MTVIGMIQIGNTLILNSDMAVPAVIKSFEGYCMVTCGLSTRSTITASSIRDDGFTYCLQRGIFSLSGKEITPQEFKVKWREKPEDLYPYLAAVTLLLLCGVSVETFAYLKF